MTGTGSGYIGNRCILNPFAGITPLYLHNLFPFIEVRSVPLYTPAIQPGSNPLITSWPLRFTLYSRFPDTLHAESPVIVSAKFDCRLPVPTRTADACSRKIFLSAFVGERIYRCLLARTCRQSRGQKNNQPFGTGLYQREKQKTVQT